MEVEVPIDQERKVSPYLSWKGSSLAIFVLDHSLDEGSTTIPYWVQNCSELVFIGLFSH